MQAYTGFARVYDSFMDNAPYDKWECWLAEQLAGHGIDGGLVLELGCGTGVMTERLAARGYDMIGVDLSEDMLACAMEKRDISGADILYLQQDMREFELYGTVAAVYCICDSLNYLTEPAELVQVFRLVNNYLDPGGVFLFDINTPVAYMLPQRQVPIADMRGDIAMIWENEFDETARINRHRVTFFVPLEEEEEELYERIQEIHIQRAYTPAEIRAAVAEAGMTLEAVYVADAGEVSEGTRLLFVAREKGKLPAEIENRK